MRTWSVCILLVLVASVGAYAAHSYMRQTASLQPPAAVMRESQPPADAAGFSQFSEAPSKLDINSIDVSALIIPVGLEVDGAMQAPATQEDVGWYERSAKAGEDSKYSVLMDGHYGTDADKGVFYRLHELRINDTITVHGSEGGRAVYKIVEKERARLEDVDMKKAYYVYPGATQSITLITCQGEYDEQRATYDDRVVLYAVRIK